MLKKLGFVYYAPQKQRINEKQTNKKQTVKGPNSLSGGKDLGNKLLNILSLDRKHTT